MSEKWRALLRWLGLSFDGIQDSELPPDSDWLWLTPMERLGVQSQADADIARKLIEERKRASVQPSGCRCGGDRCEWPADKSDGQP